MTATTLTSPDGTPIACTVDGDGPPLVLVHGTTSDKGGFVLVTPALAQHRRLWTYDRRGRGDSGDAPTHSLDQEVDDLLTVIGAAGAGEAVDVFAHSFGACVALEAAARAPQSFSSLAVYEPPFHVARAEAAARRSVAAAKAGDADTALEEFYIGVAACVREEVDMLRSMPPVWDGRRATVPTIAREYDALAAVGWQPDRYSGITCPVLVLWGECTGDAVYVTTEVVEAIPHASTHVLAGQRHLATLTGPSLVTDALLAFLTARR